MDYSKNETHEEIRRGIRDLCKRFPDEYWAEHDESHEFPWEFYNAMAEGGWMGLTVPEEYGGGGLGVTEAAIVEREIAASGAGMGGCSAVHIGIFGFEPIIHHGSEEMKRKYLPRVVTGELHTSFAVTEPDAGTDTTNIRTFAKKVDGGWLVSGKKVWITKAQEAERLIILCRNEPRRSSPKRTDGMTLFFAPVDRDRVTVRKIEKLGRNAVVSCEVRYDGLRVPVSRRIGEEGEGFRYLLDGLNPERILLGSESLGIGRAAMSRAVQYAKDRVVFDRPIGQNQGIAFPLAEAHMKLHAAELVVREASWRFDQGLPCGEAANTAKYLAAEAAFFACDRAMQTHGGMGYAREYHVERYWREARLMKIAPVSQEMVCNYIGANVLGLPKSY